MSGRLQLAQTAADLLARIRRDKTRVHCLTNTVVQKFTADGLSALGALPSMTSNMEEIGDFAGRADALLVNLGTLDAQRRQVIEAAISAVRDRAQPWVLDPVMCHLSPTRLSFAQALLRHGPAALRGNSAEITALQPPNNVLVVETGIEDRITGSGKAVTISNGHPLMAAVTGTGCLSGAVLAAFLAVEPQQPLLAAASAFLVIGVSAELAAKHARGPGTFEPAFLDALAAVDLSELQALGRIDYAQG